MWEEVGYSSYYSLLWSVYGQDIFISPVRKYRKSYCTTPGVGVGVGSGGCVGVNKNVQVLRQSFDGFSFYLV